VAADSSDQPSTHFCTHVATVVEPADVAMNSPRAFDTSSDAAKSSASRFVLNPRSSDCYRPGVR
jgi:hypothetical protein